MERVSAIYILNKDNKVLMLYNRKQESWLPPGGFVEDEFTYENAIRETKEEVGDYIGDSLEFLGNPIFENPQLDERAIVLPTPLFVAKQTLTSGKVVENFIYLARTNNDRIDNSIEKHDVKWFTFQEVKNIDTFENVKVQLDYIKRNIDKFKVFPIHKEEKYYSVLDDILDTRGF